MTIYEVEMKFRVPAGQTGETVLASLGISWGDEYEEFDCYYEHPSRDFLQTDEALRIRTRTMPDGETRRMITYKGPKIDSETKTRKEIEIGLGANDPWESVLESLGFRPCGHVRKFRRRGSCVFQSREFDVLLDRLPDLKSDPGGGRFIELETLADESQLSAARQSLLNLARQLGLGESIRISYLGLLAGTACR